MHARRAQLPRHYATTLVDILNQVAARHQFTARVDDALAARPVAHIDQTHGSDLNFVTRPAQLHDVVATVKQGRLLFLPIANTTTSTGAFLPAVHIARADGDSHRLHTGDREAACGRTGTTRSGPPGAACCWGKAGTPSG